MGYKRDNSHLRCRCSMMCILERMHPVLAQVCLARRGVHVVMPAIGNSSRNDGCEPAFYSRMLDDGCCRKTVRSYLENSADLTVSLSDPRDPVKKSKSRAFSSSTLNCWKCRRGLSKHSCLQLVAYYATGWSLSSADYTICLTNTRYHTW